VRVTITGGMNRPPYERGEATGKLFEHARAQAAAFGHDLQEVPRTGGGSDGNFTAALGVPTLDGLGAVGGNAHAEGEWLDTTTMTDRAALVRALLERLTGPEGEPA
jgi:glutamate carboxypeptidase